MSFNKNILGKTGIEVSELCLGTLIHGALQACMTPEEGAVSIRRALELGINFIDTAKTYKTYDHIRLGSIDFKNVVIASKSPAKSAGEMRNDVEIASRNSIVKLSIYFICILSEQKKT